jgi:hypothetical protein
MLPQSCRGAYDAGLEVEAEAETETEARLESGGMTYVRP